VAYPTKITTCCEWGARAALVVGGKERNELSCSGCGAPIHVMKRVASEAPPPPSRTQPHARAEKRKAVSHRPEPKSFRPAKPDKYDKPRKRKKRKSMLKWVLEEAKDVIEDIFD